MCFADDYDSLQSQSDAVKAESQALPSAATSESLGPSTVNPSEGIDIFMDNRTLSRVTDDDQVLNLVKVKKPEETAETEAGGVAKEEGEQKHDVKLSELLKSEPVEDVPKEHERDDEDTLSESETVAANVKPVTAASDVVDAVKDEALLKLEQKAGADEEMDNSAVTSPCPEVRHLTYYPHQQ